MSLGSNKIGEGYIPAYQIAPIPFVTGSSVSLGQTKEIQFDRVTKHLTVKNESPTSTNVIAIAFTENGLKTINSNYFTLSGSQSFSQEIRCDRVFISGSVGTSEFRVIAGVTDIHKSAFLLITGSNGFVGVG